MAETNEILEASRKLGQLVATHPVVEAYMTVVRQLDLDVAAQELLGKFQQLTEHLMMKQQMGQPIDLNEKTAHQSLSQSIQIHPLLMKFLKTREEYAALMQGVQEQINVGLTGPAPGADAPAAEPSKIILD